MEVCGDRLRGKGLPLQASYLTSLCPSGSPLVLQEVVSNKGGGQALESHSPRLTHGLPFIHSGLVGELPNAGEP